MQRDHPPGACSAQSLHQRAPTHLRGSSRIGGKHRRTKQRTSAQRLLQVVAQHGSSGVHVSNHSSLQRLDDVHLGDTLFKHLLGLGAKRHRSVVRGPVGDQRRLTHDHAAVFDRDVHVRCPYVNCYL